MGGDGAGSNMGFGGSERAGLPFDPGVRLFSGLRPP